MWRLNLYRQILPNAYNEKVSLAGSYHASRAANHVTQHHIGQPTDSGRWEKWSWQSEQSHASKDDYYTHCMRKEKRPEGHVHQKGKWRRGKAGIEKRRRGEEEKRNAIHQSGCVGLGRCSDLINRNRHVSLSFNRTALQKSSP